LNLGEALDRAVVTLRESGIAEAALDAELLLRHATGHDRAALLTRPEAPLPADAAARFLALVSERATRRPLQHLTGSQAFWRHDFLVTKDVLIPRPETEVLVEQALHALKGASEPVVIDVGTGSGCIALSLAHERKDAVVHATDVSAEALVVARANAARLELAERVAFHLGDLLDPLPASLRFDLVASNPPYVDPADARSLAPEVRDHEPALALFPPVEPYSVYRRLLPSATRRLRPGGFLVLEVGQGMADEVVTLCRQQRLVVVTVAKDLAGIPRTVVARRSA
jgi:release factor glutamine methyltransferase